MSSEVTTVLLVDDHTLVREGLRVLLRAAPDIVVVGEAGDGSTGVLLTERLGPSIVVLDLDMPGGAGTEALRAIRAKCPDVRVLILTMYAERERLLPLLEAGAHGYLTKEAASRDLVDALRLVARGEIYVRPSAVRLLAATIVSRQSSQAARDRFGTLSEREQSILSLVAQGFSGAEIARRLAISTKTVDAYKRRIQGKLGLGHRTEYVRFAIEAGLLGG